MLFDDLEIGDDCYDHIVKITGEIVQDTTFGLVLSRFSRRRFLCAEQETIKVIVDIEEESKFLKVEAMKEEKSRRYVLHAVGVIWKKEPIEPIPSVERVVSLITPL